MTHSAATHSSFYQEYIHSDAWQRRRKRAIKRAGGKCQRCGSEQRLEVHHLTYARLGKEPPADLMVLCHACHQAEHTPRRDPVRAIIAGIARHISRKRNRHRRR